MRVQITGENELNEIYEALSVTGGFNGDENGKSVSFDIVFRIGYDSFIKARTVFNSEDRLRHRWMESARNDYKRITAFIRRNGYAVLEGECSAEEKVLTLLWNISYIE